MALRTVPPWIVVLSDRASDISRKKTQNFAEKNAKFRGIFRGKVAEKSADFAGFSREKSQNLRKNWPISSDFRGKKSKFAEKSADFAGEKSKFAGKSTDFAAF